MAPKKNQKKNLPPTGREPFSEEQIHQHDVAAEVVLDEERHRDIEAVATIAAEDIIVHPPEDAAYTTTTQQPAADSDYLDKAHDDDENEKYYECDPVPAATSNNPETQQQRQPDFFEEILQRNREHEEETATEADAQGEEQQQQKRATSAGDGDDVELRPRETTPPPTGSNSGLNLGASGVMDTRRRFGKLSVTNSSSEITRKHNSGAPYAHASETRGPSAEPFGTTGSDGGSTSSGSDDNDDRYDEHGLLKPLPIGGAIFSVLALCALVLFAVGASLPIMSRRLPDISYIVTLWKVTTKTPENIPVDILIKDMDCPERQKRFYALEVFAILTLGLTAMSVPIGIASSRQRKPLLPGIVTAGLAACFALITWTMTIGLYYKNGGCPDSRQTFFLAGSSFSAQKYDFESGFGLYVTGTVLLLLAVMVGVLQPVVPPSIRRTAVVRIMLIISAVIQILSFLFTVIGAAPTQWFYKWGSDQTTEYRITLWTNRTYENGVRLNDDSLVDSTCGEMGHFARFGQAFAMMAIASTLIGSVISVLASDLITPGGQTKTTTTSSSTSTTQNDPTEDGNNNSNVNTNNKSKLFGLRACIFAMMSTLVTTVCPFVTGLSFYFRQFCSTPSLQSDQYHITGGMVLFGCAMALSAFGLIVLLVVAVVQVVANPTSATASLGNTRWSAFLFLFFIGVCILFQSIAADTELFGKSRDEYNWEHWTFWRVYHRQSAVAYNTAFTCPSQEHRLVGAGVLNVLAIVTLAAAFLLGVGQLTSLFLRKAASIVGAVGCLLLLVSWSLVVDVFRRGSCGSLPFSTQGYTLVAGFGLLIVGWGLAVIACVVNYVLAPIKVRA
ncbi:amastin, putative [Bodo saltans]|uniref:Amastin, putative n=1 Tax=Bodo saltans TaxID=75058 RepID=A0A0S4JX34_BODSA|nr:amastin, putative [Bodo saltans]|eukprot:CUG93718.1 amastin, putative [Bodo saltans]